MIEPEASIQFLIALEDARNHEDENLSQAIFQSPNALDNPDECDDENFSHDQCKGSNRNQLPVKKACRSPKSALNAADSRDSKLVDVRIKAQRKRKNEERNRKCR